MRPSLRELPRETNDTTRRAWGLHVRRERDASTSDLGRYVSYGSKAVLTGPKADFRYSLESGLKTDIAPCPFGAIIRLCVL